MLPSRRTISAEDGTDLNVLCWQQGAASEQQFLLVHGFSNSATIWQGLAEVLLPYGDVYALDFRGHGDSGWDPEARHLHSHLVADLALVVNVLGLQNFHLIGHSLGARVALLYSYEHHPRLLSMTIIDTGPEVGDAGARKVRIDAEAMLNCFSNPDAYIKHLQGIYIMADGERLKSWGLTNIRQLPDGRWHLKTDPAFTRALWSPDSQRGDASDLRTPLRDNLWQSLAKVSCPCLLLRGQISAILTRKLANTMVEGYLPRAQLQTIKRAGHALMLDAPDSFESAVVEFIRDID